MLVLYSLAAVGLALYGFNTLFTAWLYWRKRADTPVLPSLADFPTVTVQLPIYDEMYVVERLIDAAASMDWPRERLQIQVLDDSDDETTAIAQKRIELYKSRGIDIALIKRPDRSGYKAGALAAGLASARGEYIAIFDADFVPPAYFLKKTIPYFSTRSNLGLVQTRWGHLNADYSALTRAQGIALDSHFVVEQTARSRNGLFMNFNGTAGVWRRRCIEECGGWQGDTLSEDLDLSYRAQIRGWRFMFLPDVVSPAEIPPQIHALKRQQFRWAKGSIQCLVKIGPVLVTKPNLPILKRIQGILHLSAYLVHPLMLVLLLTLIPLMAEQARFPEFMAYFSLAMFGPLTVFILSQRALYPDWGTRFRYIIFLILLGTGLALNNTFAVLGAFTRQRNTFRRTPKFSVAASGDSWNSKRYTLPFGWEALGELGLAAYALFGVVLALQNKFFWTAPFLLLYAASFGFTGCLSLWHSRPPGSNTIKLAAT
ncbi:MAG: glycosyltransferase [Chloroflexi bacterium]|nr:glycosyltransferase [Chloroflexota bacterium]